MTGTLRIRQTRKGKVYDALLEYKDSQTGKWHFKQKSTGIFIGQKREAKEKLKQLLDQYAYLERHSINSHQIKLCDYLEIWIEERKSSGIRLSTYEGYHYRLQHAIRYFREIRPIKLIDASYDDWHRYFEYEFQYGKRNQKDSALMPLSIRSIRSQKSLLKEAMDDAIIRGLITVNWIGMKKLGGCRSNRSFSSPIIILSSGEILDYLTLVRKMYPALLPIAYMVLSYGLRRSEVLGLRWDMIDFKRKIIHISRTITKIDTQLENDLTKTPAGNRECEFLPNTEEMLRLLESTPKTHQGGCKSPHGAADICDYVFRKPDGAPYRLDYISHAFKKIAIAYGRPDLTLHKLRHSCASILHDLGWNVKKAAAWLGHADCSVTLEIYTHIEQLRTDEELMALNARLPSFSSLMSCTIGSENKACENNLRPVGK